MATRATPSRLPILSLLTASAISQVGNVLTLVTVPWFVLQTTDSPSKTGITGFVIALPVVIAGIFGGVLVDRVGFKRMSIYADLASGVTVALIPLLHLTIGLEFWQLLILAFLGALLDAPGQTARTSLYPELADIAGMPLERANSIEQASSRLSFMVGPPVAGLLIATIGPANVLWIDAASFVISAAIVAVLIPSAVRGEIDTAPEIGYLADLATGFQQLRADRLLLWLAVYGAILNFFDAMTNIIYPIYADRVYDSALDLGLILGGLGGGGLLSVAVFGAIGHRLPRRETLIGGFILLSLPLWVFVVTPPVLILIGVQALRGIGVGPINPIATTVLQERVPREMLGRVFGLLIAAAWIAFPLGNLVTGFLVEGIGLIPTLVAISTAYLAVAVSMLLIPAFHEMDMDTEQIAAISAKATPE